MEESPEVPKSAVVYPDEPLQIIKDIANATVRKDPRFSNISNISEEISENKKYYDDNFENLVLPDIHKDRIDFIKAVYPHSVNLA